MRQTFALFSVIFMLSLTACASKEKEVNIDDFVRQTPRVPAPEPRDGLIPVNKMAPNFDAIDNYGRRIMLSELLQAKQVVLVFYPGDFTPGCTKQLCHIRDQWSEFRHRNAIVIGVNPALPSRHAEFSEKYNFPFPIVCDTNGTIAEAYGARGDRPGHPARTVYVVRRNGSVAFAEYGMVEHDRIFAALDRP